jgi:hypothetical protein
VQLPFRVDRHEERAPNWEMVLPPPCAKGCTAILEELVADFSLLYDLRTGGACAH